MSIENSDVELGRAIFRGSFGGSGRSGSGSSDPGNATVMTGLALSDSADGRVLVDTGGQTVAASQGVDLPCTCNVRAGDKVIITLVGNDPTVTGVVGRGDQQQGEIDGAQSSADEAKRQAEQAKAAADSASRKADQTAADVDRKVKAAADAATQASANASAAAAKADQLSGKVTDLTTTVSGLSTKVEGAARDATSALTASSKTSQSLGALTSTVEQHYTEQQATAGKADRAARDAASSLDRVSKVEQTAAGIKTQVTATAKTASDALSKASTAQQTADAITTKVAKDYATKADADKQYASQSQLIQTAEGLTSKVTTAQQTADAAKTAASTAKQTADGLSVTVESHYAEQRATDAKATDAKAAAGRAQSTADGAVTKATSAQATADGLKASVTKAQTTADSAVKAASSAQQTADAITATVARDYLSKADASKSYASQSSVKQTADGLSVKVTTAQRTADAAKTAAAGAVQKGSSGISSLETAMQFDSSGLSIFKKVNNAISGFIAKVTGSAFQICDRTGRVLSQFTDKRIDLGKSSQDTTISMCQDNVRIYSSSKGGAGSKGEVNASYILCDTPIGSENRSTFSIGFGVFSDNPANDMPRETPYVTLGVDDAHGGDSVTIGAQSVRVNLVDWTARHGRPTQTGGNPSGMTWACSGGLCTVSAIYNLDSDLPSWASRTLATGLPRTAARAWSLACTQQLPDGTLRDLQVLVEPDGDSPTKMAKVTLIQKGGAGIPSGSWLFVSGTYPLAQDGDWYEPYP